MGSAEERTGRADAGDGQIIQEAHGDPTSVSRSINKRRVGRSFGITVKRQPLEGDIQDTDLGQGYCPRRT